MAYGRIKTEHTGAKNGGGHRGKRVDAKLYSRKRRRVVGRRIVKEATRGQSQE